MYCPLARGVLEGINIICKPHKNMHTHTHTHARARARTTHTYNTHLLRRCRGHWPHHAACQRRRRCRSSQCRGQREAPVLRCSAPGSCASLQLPPSWTWFSGVAERKKGVNKSTNEHEKERKENINDKCTQKQISISKRETPYRHIPGTEQELAVEIALLDRVHVCDGDLRHLRC